MSFDRWSYSPAPCCDSDTTDAIWDAPITDDPAGSYVSNYGKNFALPVDASGGSFDPSTWDVLFDEQTAPSLSRFFSVASPGEAPPLCFVNGSHLVTYSGQGNYGLAVFEEPVQDFEIWVDVEVPQGTDRFLSNSGVFVRIEDPRLVVLIWASGILASRRTTAMVGTRRRFSTTRFASTDSDVETKLLGSCAPTRMRPHRPPRPQVGLRQRPPRLRVRRRP